MALGGLGGWVYADHGDDAGRDEVLSVLLLWRVVSGVMSLAPTHGRYASPGTVPRVGMVRRKYAGHPCQICGTVIPARQPQGAVNGMLFRGPYCSQSCWQHGGR